MKARIVLELQREVDVKSIDEALKKAEVLVEALQDRGFEARIEIVEVGSST